MFYSTARHDVKHAWDFSQVDWDFFSFLMVGPT